MLVLEHFITIFITISARLNFEFDAVHISERSRENVLLLRWLDGPWQKYLQLFIILFRPVKKSHNLFILGLDSREKTKTDNTEH